MQQVEDGRQGGTGRAQAELERGHGSQAGIAADHGGAAQQQHADADAEQNRQQRIAGAQARRQQRTGLQHHQAEAEGEPEGKQVASAENALVEGDR
ncbi:hypothetical protein D3C72_2082610 [compost metagenome]